MKQKNSSYKYYLVRLSSTPIPQLVEYFNNEVGSRAWTSERAAFNAALIDALIHKGVDVTDIYDGKRINFNHKVDFDSTLKQLSTIA